VHTYREDAEDWMVLFQEGTTEAQMEALCDGHCPFIGNPSSGGLAFAMVQGKEWLIKMLTGDHSIQLIEPNEVDTMIPEKEEEVSAALVSWGLDTVGVGDRPGTGRGVHIYVQDTGVRVSHKDFGGRAIATLDFSSGSMVVCGGASGCARDVAGHGTHCAGTAGGSTYGVASGATIHANKVLGDAGSGERAWSIAGIDWISSKGQKPAVISLSLGGSGRDASYKAVIDVATVNRITVVVAAGNFASDSCQISPAFVPSAITVGATEADDSRASYSNFGSCNDIMAPGTAITSASQTSDSRTARLTGTSMACPHVSGAAAILLEQNPSWNRNSIMNHLTEFGRKGIIKGLKVGDPNLLLWVGRNPGPNKPSCPSFTRTAEPSYWGDCTCKGSEFCSLDGTSRNCPSSGGVGGWGGSVFAWTCIACKCY